MEPSLRHWLEASQSAGGTFATEVEMKQLERLIRCRLPDQIRQVLLTVNRAEGFVDESYIAFFDLSDIAEACVAQVPEIGFIPFASNGGGELYGLDCRRQPPGFVLMPAVGTEWKAAIHLGSDWETFWQALARGNLFDSLCAE